MNEPLTIEQANKLADKVDEKYFAIYLEVAALKGQAAMGLPGRQGLPTLESVVQHLEQRKGQIDSLNTEYSRLMAAQQDSVMSNYIRELAKGMGVEL